MVQAWEYVFSQITKAKAPMVDLLELVKSIDISEFEKIQFLFYACANNTSYIAIIFQTIKRSMTS